jgi:hypothetical protein
MLFLSILFSAAAAGLAFIWRGAYNKISSSETESTASDMSHLSYEKELGEVSEGGVVDDGPLVSLASGAEGRFAPSRKI